MLVIFELTQGPGHQPDKSAWEWKYTCATITKVSDFIKKLSITLTSATEQMWTTRQKNIGKGAAVLCRKYCFPCRRKQPTFLDATTGLPMTSRLRNEHKNSIVMTLLIGWKYGSSNQNHRPDLGSDAQSIWNFYAHSSGVISLENQWWRREMSATF